MANGQIYSEVQIDASSRLSSLPSTLPSSSLNGIVNSTINNKINCDAENGFVYTGHDSSWSSNDIIGISMLALLLVINLTWTFIYFNSKSKSKSSTKYIRNFAVFISVLWVGFLAYRPILFLYMPSSIISWITHTPEYLDRTTMFPNYYRFEQPEAFEKLRQEVDKLLSNTNNGNKLSLFADTYGGENRVLGNFKKDNDVTRAWRVFNIKLGGTYSKNGLEHFPYLKSLLDELPEIIACMISVVEPGIRVPLHYGYYKGIMRYMIPTHVPKEREKVFLCVNGIKYHWTKGEGVLWDDTYAHKVYNEASEPRVVIFLDVMRPITADKSSWFDAFNTLVVKTVTGSPIVQDEIRRTEKQVKF